MEYRTTYDLHSKGETIKIGL